MALRGLRIERFRGVRSAEVSFDRTTVLIGENDCGMCVLNAIDRFHLVGDVINRVPSLGSRAAYAKQAIRDALIDHREYITKHGEDDPRILGWH